MTVVFLYREPKVEIIQYALKGVERFVDYKDIYVVGDVPEWWEYKSIRTKPVKCEFQDYHNSLKAIEIDNDILLMADDIFITKPYKPIHYYNGKLKDRPRQGKRKEVFDNTLSVYPEINNFNLHRPIPVKREVFRRTVDLFDKPFSHDAFCFGYPTKEAEDCKVKQPNPDMPIFSTYNENQDTIAILEKVYD